jgi:hypothetical protein
VRLHLNLTRWLRPRAVILAGLVLLCAQLAWTADLLAHSYFRQDDFGILDRAAASRFDWNYLMAIGGSGHGHLRPIGLAIAWALARAPWYDWPLASVVIGVLVAAASLALLRVLVTLFGTRPAILVPLAVYMFGPLSLGAVGWWSSALEVLPLQLAIFAATSSHVRYLRSVSLDRGRWRYAIAAAVWLAVGMASADQGALVPFLLLAITAGYFVPGRWTHAVRRAATSYWRAWLSYGVPLACYCAVFFFQLARSGLRLAGPGLASRLYQFAGTLIGQAAIPGALGGPWQWLASGFAQASPPTALEYLSWAVAALVVGVSCVYRMRAWRAWVILAGWVVAADILPVAIVGFGTLPATSLGAQTGYLSDATAVLALCLGLAFLPLADPQAADLPAPAQVPAPAQAPAQAADLIRVPASPRPIPRPVLVVTLLAFCAFAVGTVVSGQAFVTASPAAASRSYIATARLAIGTAPQGTVIVDGPTPATVMNPAFFSPGQGYTSQVIGALADPARADRWTLTLDGVIAGPMTFDDHGQLRPVTVLGPASRPGGCREVPAAGTSIPIDGSLYRWPWTARLSYSGPAGLLAVSFGGTPNQVSLPSGRHVVYVPVVGDGSTVSLQFAGRTSRAFCVTSVTVGSLHPEPAARAIPAAPVPG